MGVTFPVKVHMLGVLENGIVDIKPNQTIKKIKSLIQKNILCSNTSNFINDNISFGDSILIYDDIVLEDCKFVEDYGIKANDDICAMFSVNQNNIIRIACYCCVCYSEMYLDIHINSIDNKETPNKPELICISCDTPYPYPNIFSQSLYNNDFNNLLLILHQMTKSKQSILYKIPTDILEIIFNYLMYSVTNASLTNTNHPMVSFICNPIPKDDECFHYALFCNPYKRFYEWHPVQIVDIDYKQKKIGIIKCDLAPIIWISMTENICCGIDWNNNAKTCVSKQNTLFIKAISESLKYSKIYINKEYYTQKIINDCFETQNELNVIIQTLTGKSINIHCKSSNTTLELKILIWKKEGIPHYQSRLIHYGRGMQNSKTLSHYNVQSGNVIHLILRLGNNIDFMY